MSDTTKQNMARRARRLLPVGLLAPALFSACARGSGESVQRIAITDVTVFDGTGSAPRPHQTIVFEGDSIAAIGPADSVTPPKGAQIVPGNGRFVMPGLWDQHVHLTAFDERSLPLYIANGVTSVRDVGGVLARLRVMRAGIDSGRLIGPRIIMGGPILDGPATVTQTMPLVDAIRVGVADSAAGAAIVDSLAAHGVEHIKVHSELSRAAYFAILVQARRHSLPVLGHVPDVVTAMEAVVGGQHAIEHQFGIPIANTTRVSELTDRLAVEMRRYRDSTRGRTDHPLGTHHVRLRVDDTALASYDSAAARRFAEEVVRRGVWLDPTLAVLRVAARMNEDSVARPATLRYLPAELLARSPQEPLDPNASPAVIEAGRTKLRRWLDAFRMLHRAGARFTTGTDVGFNGVVPGFSVHDEVELLTQVGLSPMEALTSATGNSATSTGKLARVGTLEAGKAADLVILAADPLADIRNTRRIDAVVARGKLYDREMLDSLLALVERAVKR